MQIFFVAAVSKFFFPFFFVCKEKQHIKIKKGYISGNEPGNISVVYSSCGFFGIIYGLS
jgi:hypothetical protein